MTATEFRIRWGDERSPATVVARADPAARTATVTLPDGTAFTVDVVAARAIPMLLSHLVFAVLDPEGPMLTIEARAGGDWTDLRGLR